MARFLTAFVLALCLAADSGFAFDAPVAIKEHSGVLPPELTVPCALPISTDGTCANYRWYNLCSGYIWIYSIGGAGEAVGTRFGGPEQPCVTQCRDAKRAITYWRNVAPGYSQTVDVYLDDDDDGDGCPDGVLASDLAIDPGLRWNCFDVGTCFNSTGAIVRLAHDGGSAPTVATDGPFTQDCDPVGMPRSYYYGIGTTVCLPWIGPTGRADNFLTWLIVDLEPSCSDCPPTAIEPTTWGSVKSLFR